jgi:3-dehydroquinate synthase
MRPYADVGPLSEFGVNVSGRRGYQIVVGPGAVSRLAPMLADAGAVRVAIICDSNLQSLHGSRVADLLREAGFDFSTHAFPQGESSKTRQTKSNLEDELLASGHGMDSVVVSVGGGVTIDLAGFVAATYMRGIPVVHLPTSLLAMADAAIGGKTGVDHPMGKNLIGAFHPPLAVLADTTFLDSLPPVEIRQGLSEIVKAGVIRDAGHFEQIEREMDSLAAGDNDAVSRALMRSVKVKVDVVSKDEREGDLRKILNFGHTVGHAIEKLSGYRIRHGEAVAMGMVAEARMAIASGFFDKKSLHRLENLLAGLGLSVAIPSGLSAESILDASRSDKKARGGHVEYALPDQIGRMARTDAGYGIPVRDEFVLASLQASME